MPMVGILAGLQRVVKVTKFIVTVFVVALQDAWLSGGWLVLLR
jgi:hypothetical protein